MKVEIIGLEASAPGAVSKKSGQEYDIGAIHAVARLAPPFDSKGIAKGGMGTTYRCSSEVVRKCSHLPLPFSGELVFETVMRFGKPDLFVTDLRPLVAAK